MNKEQPYIVVGSVMIQKKFTIEVKAESADAAKQKIMAEKGSAGSDVIIDYVYAKNVGGIRKYG